MRKTTIVLVCFVNLGVARVASHSLFPFFFFLGPGRSLHFGDQVVEADDAAAASSSSKPWIHANTYTMLGCVKSAFKEIGKGTTLHTGSVGFDANRRGLGDLATVAALARTSFQQHTKSVHADIAAACQAGETGMFFPRNFDSTPLFCKFGKLAGSLVKHARYLQKVFVVSSRKVDK